MQNIKKILESLKKSNDSKTVKIGKVGPMLNPAEYLLGLGLHFYRDPLFRKFVYEKTKKVPIDLPKEQQLELLKEFYKGLF
jgi:hypothetical protein